MPERDGDGSPGDRSGEGRRGGFTLWAARHPLLSALLTSVVITLLVFAKSAFFAVGSGRPLHSRGPRLWIGAGLVETFLFVALAAFHLAVARARRRSGRPLTADALDLPFVEDRDAAARRPPASLVLRPSLRQPFGLLMMVPLLVGVLSAIAAWVDVEDGRRAILWIGQTPLWLAAGAWTTTGYRRQRIVVDSDHVYIYTFTGRYRRVERSRVAELRWTRTNPRLAGADGERLVALPAGLTRGQAAELARVLWVPAAG